MRSLEATEIIVLLALTDLGLEFSQVQSGFELEKNQLKTRHIFFLAPVRGGILLKISAFTF